jgi:hypothetical protein
LIYQRQAAEALPEIVDFDEVDLLSDQDLMNYHMNLDDYDKDLEHQTPNLNNNNINESQSLQNRDWNESEVYPDHLDMFDRTLVDNDCESAQLCVELTANQSFTRRHSQLGGGRLRSFTGADGMYDKTITGIGPTTINIQRSQRHSSFGVIPKKEFATRINLLSQQRRWAEKAARR